MNDVFRTAIIIPKNTFEIFFLDFTDIFLTFIVIDSSKATFGKTFPIYCFFTTNDERSRKFRIGYKIQHSISN